MANHLLIGLGGTGGKILRAMRKRIYEEFGSNELTDKTHLGYIYVDSDERDLKDDASWNYMGNDVSLSPSEKVNIHGIGGGILSNLNAYPGIRSFITEDDRKLMQDDQVSAIIDAGIGGQRRRFGRILLANNITNDPINGFSAVLRDRIIGMTHAHGEGRITFHICAGLAGGTGSGSVVDAVSQLHKIISPMGRAFEVYLYLYIPEILVEDDVNVQGFYHGNGYAALQEINALALGNYKPLDVSGKIDNKTGKVQRLIDGMNSEAFKRAYLFSNRNEADQVLKKDTKLPDTVADFLYQRIIAGETEGGQLGRVSEMENAGTPPEKDASNVNVHARNFMTFGLKRIEYPESEIKEYSSDKCVQSALTALVYNNWVDRRGYSSMADDDAGIGYGQEVRQPATQTRLLLDYNHLTLQEPVANFAGTDEWNSYDEYWDTYCNYFSNDVLETEPDRHRWIGAFLEICETEYNNNFRGMGVTNFFNVMKEQREVKRYASVLCKHIENTLFKEWISGIHTERQTMSLQRIRLYIDELEKATRERIPKVDTLKSSLLGQKETVFAECTSLAERLEDTGWLANALFAKARQHFQQYTTCKSKDYALSTKIAACSFARLLLEEIVTRLHDMLNAVIRLENLFKQAGATANAKAEATCRGNNENRQGEVEVIDKVYDPTDVRVKVEKILLANEELQTKIKNENLEKLKELVAASGKETCFWTIYSSLGGATLRDNKDKILLDNQDYGIEENTEVIVNFITANIQTYIASKLENPDDEDSQLLGVNVLERIKQECPTDQQLKAYLDKIVDSCRVFMQFNQSEFGRVPEGQQITNMGQGVQICLPEYDDPTNFRDKFIRLLRGKFAGTIFKENSIALNGRKKNQIVLIMINSGFPLRFIQNVNYLKEQYDGMISEHNVHGKLNKVLLHTESLSDRVLPSLFEEEEGDIRKRMIVTALKAYLVPNLIEKGEDPDTGDDTFEINIGTRMDEVICTIGANYLKTVEKLCEDAGLRGKLVEYIDNACDETFKNSRDKEKLCKLVEDFVFDVILPLCGGNKRSAEFVEIKDAAKEFMNSLMK